jgi:hypothetical protein
MMKYKRYGWLLLLVVLVPFLAYGQEAVLRLIPYPDGGGYLQQQIINDTTANGKLPNRVYELTRGGLYLANATFINTGGWKLRLRAADSTITRKPRIFLYPTGTGTTPWNPPGYLFTLQGDLEMKNIIVSGWYEAVRDSNLRNLQGCLVRTPATTSGLNITIDSCIFTNSNGNHVRTEGPMSAVKITNSIFANMGYLGRSNLGAGKAVDLRDVAVDTMIMVNNTFVNWQDRIVRHYPATAGQPTGLLKYFRFDHNTLVNGMSYHGMLSLGTMGGTAIITNNLLIDPFSLGADTDKARQAEFIVSGELDSYGKARMNWIFSYPDQVTAWTISNNYYSISDSGQAFYTSYASEPGFAGNEGAPLTWHINGRLGADSASAFTKQSVALNKIPEVMNKLNRWYRSPTGGAKSKNTPGAWIYGDLNTIPFVDPYDFDRKHYLWLRDTLDCKYSTSSPAYTGGVGGYPLGDLNWYPALHDRWTKGLPVGVADAPRLPEQFSLGQNYPNPFNPATTISYSVPKESRVMLKVFDMLGREVATLVNEVKQPGEYRLTFDASRFASGAYVYRLSSPNQTIVRKMMLMK